VIIGNVIGKPLDRVDGRLKVTGQAKYAAEFSPSGYVYAFPVRARIGNGLVSSFDLSDASGADGVIQILTHLNAPRLRPIDQEISKSGGMLGEQLLPLQDAAVHYFGQFIAVVIAQTFEQARTAASLVKVNYSKQAVSIDLDDAMPTAERPQKARGEDVQINPGMAQPVIASSPVKVDVVYRTPTENHHPMEPHATVSAWDGADKLKIYDATQGVKGAQGTIAYLFRLQPDNVQIISPFVGGGFGCKGSQWPHLIISALAAKAVGKPVKLAVTRQMMVTNVGRRPETIQNVAIGADHNGKISAIRHDTNSYKANSEYFEQCGLPAKILYSAPLREITYKIAKLNVNAPTFMRAPGETPGSFALESAMDELAHELKMDPIKLREINHTTIDPLQKKPFSLENLQECYRVGAERIGWSRRQMTPGAVRSGNSSVGIGMAAATYPANRGKSSARIRMTPDGQVTVSSATQDIGTGTYTIMAQTAADALGVPMERVKVELGDSSLPPSPVSGGSQTAVSVTTAVLAATALLKKDVLAEMVADKASRLNGRSADQIAEDTGGVFYLKDDRTARDSIAEAVRRRGRPVEVCATVSNYSSGSENEGNPEAKKSQQQPGPGGSSAPCSPIEADPEADSNKSEYSFHSFGAQFAEVNVDQDTGMIRVTRFVSVHDVGRVLNEKTARSQIIGGVIYGLGQALMEETRYDKRYGNPVNRTLADYHVPVNLDVPIIDVHFIGTPDPHISPIGARGIGEIGITGVAAAVANAVFNATGKRLRDLPLTPDRLI
jgi:xanthine dehydrogenase YagR molybdenum-binding subunit